MSPGKPDGGIGEVDHLARPTTTPVRDRRRVVRFHEAHEPHGATVPTTLIREQHTG